MGKHPLFDIFIRERTVAILRGLAPGTPRRAVMRWSAPESVSWRFR